MAHGGKAVVFLHGRSELRGVHARLASELLERVGLEGPARLFGVGPFLLEIRELRADGHHHADAKVDPFVLFHVLKGLAVVDDVHRSADTLQRIPRKRPLEHDDFITETLALRRQPQMRLLRGGTHVIRRRHAAGTRTVGSLHFGTFFTRTDRPGHADAVTRLPLLRETVRVREAQILFTHFLVVEEPARRDDGRLGIHGHGVARLVLPLNARHAAVFHDEHFAPSFGKKASGIGVGGLFVILRRPWSELLGTRPSACAQPSPHRSA